MMSNSSRAFKHLSPDELKWVDATLFRNYHLDPEFAELPLARVCRKWSSMGRNYLSPFALAGITRHSPQQVLEEIEKEYPVLYDIHLCRETMLPVVGISWGSPGGMEKQERKLDLSYKERAVGAVEDDLNSQKEELSTCSSTSRRYQLEQDISYLEEELEVLSKLPSFEELLASFGGKDWRKHCTNVFDGSEWGGRKARITASEWRDLRRAYLGRELSPTEEVLGVAWEGEEEEEEEEEE